jgi:hypothetical protein
MKRPRRVLLAATIVVAMVTVVGVAVAKNSAPSTSKVKVGPGRVPIGGAPADTTSPPAAHNTPSSPNFWTPDRMAHAQPDPNGSARSAGPSGPTTSNPAPGQTAGGSPPSR